MAKLLRVWRARGRDVISFRYRIDASRRKWSKIYHAVSWVGMLAVIAFGVAGAYTGSASGEMLIVLVACAASLLALPYRWWSYVSVPALAVVGAAGLAGGNYSWLLLGVMLTLLAAGLRGLRRVQMATMVLCVLWVVAAVVSDPQTFFVFAGLLPLVVATVAGAAEAVRRSREEVAWRMGAEAARQESVLRAVTEERQQVARDLHDSVARTLARIHTTLSVMEVGASPDEQRAAREQIFDLCENGMAILAEYVSVMRGGRVPPRLRVAGAGEWGQGPNSNAGKALVADIELQVAELRVLGHEVESTIQVAGADPDTAALAALVVREASANVTKHAPQAEVRMNVSVTDQALDVDISNTLPEQPTAKGLSLFRRDRAGPRTKQPSSGVGLALITDDVQAAGGSVSAGAEQGRWVLRATVPATKADTAAAASV